MAWSVDEYNRIDFKAILGNVDIVYSSFDQYLTDGFYGEDITLIRIRDTEYFIDIGEYPIHPFPDYPNFRNTDICVSIASSPEIKIARWVNVISTDFAYQRDDVCRPHVDSIIKEVVRQYNFVRKYPRLMKLLTYWARFSEWCWFRKLLIIRMCFILSRNRKGWDTYIVS
jgi:hypothetical protein